MSAKKKTKTKQISNTKPIFDPATARKDSKYWVNMIMSIYAFLVVCVIFAGLALFIPDAYYDIVTWKFVFIYNATKIIAIFFGLLLLVYFGGRGMSARDILRYKPIAGIDLAMLLFFFAVGISYLCSDYKFVEDPEVYWPAQGAYYGTVGWYIGFLLFAMCVFLYFLVAHFLNYSKWVLVPIVASSSLVFLWGIFNRFGVSLFVFDGWDTGFLASIGNINWYCGYMSVLLPITVGLYWYKGAQAGTFNRLLYATLVLVGFLIAVINGSDSGIFALVIMFVFLGAFSFSDEKRLQTFAELVLIFGLSNMAMTIIKEKLPKILTYTGQFTAIFHKLIFAELVLGIAVVFFVFALLFAKGVIKYPEFLRRVGGTLVVGIACIGIFGALALIIINTKKGGTLPVIGQNKFFLFDDYWGSHRGIIWRAGIMEFKSLSPLRKLIGVGPDCFYDATTDNPELFAIISKHYPDMRLTNCHNAFLTLLNDTGIFGVLTFGGVLFMTCKSLLAKLDDHPEVMMVPLSIVMYLANNVVSFQTITSTPFLFMVIAVGAAMLVSIERQENR